MRKKEILFFCVIFIILVINSIHQSYPDEMDNILGGYLINKGFLPYIGFFTHHGPLAYYLASFITFFSGQSFVKFRLITPLFFSILAIGSFFVFKKRIKTVNPNIFLLYIGVLALSSTYFWAHMFLADPISGYFLIPAYALLSLKIYKNEVLKKIDLGIISVFSSLSLINSPTYSYSVFILGFFTFLYFIFISNKNFSLSGEFINKILIFIFIFAAPYVLFVIFLFITRTFGDYSFQALIYNKNYYIYNYPRPEGSTLVNPIRYAVIIFNNFFNAYEILLAAVKNVDFINPFNITLALSNFILWTFFILRKKYFLFLFSLLLIIFVNVRSNPLNVKATDYQAAVYLMLSFFNSSFLFYLLKDGIKEIKDYFSKILLTILFILFIIFWFFTLIFLFAEWWRMAYLRYMGTMPLIYDRPQVARMINDVVPKDRYCWVGPFDFEEILYLNCKLPSRFHIIRPPFIKIDSIKRQMISDFSKNKADIIILRHNVFREGKDADDKFFTDFLKENYIRLKDFNKGRYVFKNSVLQNFNLSEDVYLEKIKADELVKKLFEKGYIEVIK